MKTKRAKAKGAWLLGRKKELSPMEILHQEQKQLLTEQKDFYIEEAYKSLRTNVMFSLTDDSESKVVLVTSSMPGEGKSTTSANLAISFAQAGKKTLLIDCDMRKPKLSRLMNLKSNVGLSNVLMHPKLCESAILSTKEHMLKAMTAGDVPPNPSELLGSQRMKELLKLLRNEFDYIILDTPPVNVVTDAMVLSPLTDGAIFVVRSGLAERGAVQRAVNQLKRTNVKLLGFVLNGVEKQNSTYGKYRTNGYGYGYGYGDHQESGNLGETTISGEKL